MFKALLLCVGSWLFIATFVVNAQEPIGQIETLVGSADVTRGDQAAQALQVDDLIYQEDTVRTRPKSRLDIRLNDGSQLSLDENSRLVLAEYTLAAEPQGFFNVLRGSVRSVVTGTFADRRNSFRVRTSTALMGVQGTDFLTEAQSALTRITVFDGTVEVRNVDPAVPGVQLVGANQFTVVNQGMAPNVPENFSNEQAGAGINSGGNMDIQTDGDQAEDPLQIVPVMPPPILAPTLPNVPGRQNR